MSIESKLTLTGNINETLSSVLGIGVNRKRASYSKAIEPAGNNYVERYGSYTTDDSFIRIFDTTGDKGADITMEAKLFIFTCSNPIGLKIQMPNANNDVETAVVDGTFVWQAKAQTGEVVVTLDSRPDKTRGLITSGVEVEYFLGIIYN